MLNHTYTSVKNANLVDCGKKQHIASQPSPLLKDNFLGEFRTELDKKKVLANLGIATKLSLVWENITGDIGANEELMNVLDLRESRLEKLIQSSTTFESLLDQSKKAVTDIVQLLELLLGREQEGEDAQNKYIEQLLADTTSLRDEITKLRDNLYPDIQENIGQLDERILKIDSLLTNITNLITVSGDPSNALRLITAEKATHIWDDSLNEGKGDYREAVEGETATHIFDSSINSGEGGYREPISDDFLGLYVPDLSETLDKNVLDVATLQTEVGDIKNELVEIPNTYVTKSELSSDGDFKFVKEQDFNSYKSSTATTLGTIQTELVNTIKKGEDGHVNDLSVHLLSKYTDEDNIKITDSFEVTSGIPLDVRFVVQTLNKLYLLDPQVCYPGMGVIVNETCALYILREPLNEGVITSDYVADPKNWKCPEDLVTKALSRDEYENLDTIDEHIFYYIYEDPITQTQEPVRKQDESEKDWKKRWNEWVESLKTLLQEYMSAVWGTDIENQVLKKANRAEVYELRESVNKLLGSIDSLVGEDNNISLTTLVDRIDVAESDLQQLLGTTDPETGEVSTGKIGEIEAEIGAIKNDYVSIKSITQQNNQSGQLEYKFVTKSDYITDQNDHNDAISQRIDTNLVATQQIDLSNLPITADENALLVNGKKTALLEEVPIIIETSLANYDWLVSLNKIDPKAYYYIIEEEIYITKTTRTSNIENLDLLINAILEAIADLSNRVTLLENSKK